MTLPFVRLSAGTPTAPINVGPPREAFERGRDMCHKYAHWSGPSARGGGLLLGRYARAIERQIETADLDVVGRQSRLAHAAHPDAAWGWR